MGIQTSYKRATNQTPFKLVYGQEVVVPLHFRQHTLEIAKVLKLDIGEAKYERIFQLQKLEEDIVIALQHQESQKNNKKHGTTETLSRRTFQSMTWYCYMIAESRENPTSWKQPGWAHTSSKTSTPKDQSN